MNFKIDKSKKAKEILESKLDEFNSQYSQYLTEEISNEKFGYYIFDNNKKLVGGIYGYTEFNKSALFIDLLWIDKNYRGRGLATTLMKKIEDFGITHGCLISRVETWDFQAKEFYLKCGYKLVAEIGLMVLFGCFSQQNLVD